jgi:hypothetical protein
VPCRPINQWKQNCQLNRFAETQFAETIFAETSFA